MTIPATPPPPPLLRPPSPPLPPQSGSLTGRAASQTTRNLHRTALLQPPVYPVSLQTSDHCVFFFLFQIMQTSSCIWQFSHHRFIGVSLISLQQCWYENVNLRAVLDNTQRMTRLWTVYFVGWKIICLCNRMLWNQFE